MVKIGELLRGLSPGRLQSVGVMQVIPLLSELGDDSRFLSPAEARVSTVDYGTLSFDNDTDGVLLVPCHLAYVVAREWQDHAMGHMALVAKRSKGAFDTAMCIQQTQPGLIEPDHHKFIILPYALRERAFQGRNSVQYNRLWGAISEFNQGAEVSQAEDAEEAGDLVLFLDQYQEQLDQFVAEFECIPGQVGAIVLLAGDVIGIERAPSKSFWQSIWSALIRECYGSEALAYSSKNRQAPPTRVPLETTGVRSLEDLSQALHRSQEQERELVAQKLRQVAEESLDCEIEEKHTLDQLNVVSAYNRRFAGQFLRDGERVSYASLFATGSATRDREWQNAKPFAP